MESANPPFFADRQRFDHFDALAESADPWDLDFRCLDRGKFRADLVRVGTPMIRVTECHFNRKLQQRGAVPEGFRTFGFGVADGFSVQWRRRHVGPGDLMVFPKGDELDSVSDPGFHAYAISISEEAMNEAAAKRGFRSVDRMLPDGDLVRARPFQLKRLKQLSIRLTYDVAKDPSLILNRWFRVSLENGLVNSLLDALSDGQLVPESEEKTRVRAEALERALEIIEDRANEPVTVGEIERLSGASGRTLRYAFEGRFGMSPKAFLQTYRLDRVHRLLTRGTTDNLSVKSAADEWGFWHMGQFAKDYRIQFGELPSATLRRRLRR